jgi:hypothetical protein
MRPSGRIVLFVHDPSGTGGVELDARTLALLAAQRPVVWPDRTGPGRTLIYELYPDEASAGLLRKAS